MFDPKIYKERRSTLRRTIKSGIAVFIGNEEMPMNYPANPYHYRQDSTFLYYFGLAQPGLAGIVDADENTDILFGDDLDIDDIIWMGDQPRMTDRGALAGLSIVRPAVDFSAVIKNAASAGRPVHFLPPYRADIVFRLSDLLNIPPAEVKGSASTTLIKAVVAQRSFKIDEEVAEIEAALDITFAMYAAALKAIKPGRYEKEVVGALEAPILSAGCLPAFPTILTVNGQILHNHHHGNRMDKGRLLVVDSGSESPGNYASDITRTFPVSGTYTSKQKEIYAIVLEAQMKAINSVRPGELYRDSHLLAARTIADGLKDIGLMKGNMAAAVEQGAHALFFPHGLGHHMGLDVHDMEDLGENHVGYDDTIERSNQFGLAYLRMAKELKPGYVLTVEPGIYFIPALIDLWKSEKKFTEYINYDKLDAYRDFGGARIEDDILVTESGCRVLGKPIPKMIKDIEAAMEE
ncbi:MAG: aminopeptidase P family protein [Candidatus Aminicenantes bacterium]|nr:aminopeptidase P family protein [Candidatus Aminicenantes bacterium]